MSHGAHIKHSPHPTPPPSKNPHLKLEIRDLRQYGLVAAADRQTERILVAMSRLSGSQCSQATHVVLPSSRECLPVADEGTALLRNVGNKFPTTQHHFPGDRNAQQHSCENLKISQERRGWGGAKKKHSCRCKNEFSENITYWNCDTACWFVWVSRIRGTNSVLENVVPRKCICASREEVTG